MADRAVKLGVVVAIDEARRARQEAESWREEANKRAEEIKRELDALAFQISAIAVPDVAPLADGLNGLVRRVDGIAVPDLEPIRAELGALRGRLDGIKPTEMPDFSALVDERVRKLREELARGGYGVNIIGGGSNLTEDRVLELIEENAVDDYTDGEILPQQTGAIGVLTFTFSAEVNIAWVKFTTGTATDVCYADPLGGTPAENVGIPVCEGVPMPLHYNTSEVKVWAPLEAKVTVWGGRR